MDTRIDHFMYATASLDEGMAWAQDVFGIQPAYSGEHLGLGTRNALLSLGSAYLEIIARGPAQSLEGTLGEQFAGLSSGGLVTWAAEGDLAKVQAALLSCGIRSAGPKQTRRKTPDGELLEWALLFPIGATHGLRMPFFIDWQRCVHPRETSPMAGTFQSLSITTSHADDLRQVMAAIGLKVSISEGEPGLDVLIAARGGVVQLTSTEETRSLSLI